MLIVGVAALAVFAVGCGGSDEEPLTKAEMIKQGDAICKEAANGIAAGYKTFAKEKGLKKEEFPDKEQGYEIAEDIYLPAYQVQAEKLGELTPPSESEDQIEAIVTSTEDAVVKANANLKLLFEGDKNPFEESRKLSKAYGFKVCGTL